MKGVVFDAMGVLYEVGDDLRQLLVPFVRARGCALADEAIHRAYRRALLGELTTRQLWNTLGVVGDVRDLDREYLEGYRLVPGIHELLDDLRRDGLQLGCISNDLAEWSLARRRAHDLERRIDHWTISSDARVRKPDLDIYRAFLTSSGLSPADAVFVDDRLLNVEAARAVGLRSILVDFAQLGQDPQVPRTVSDLRRALKTISGEDR